MHIKSRISGNSAYISNSVMRTSLTKSGWTFLAAIVLIIMCALVSVGRTAQQSATIHPPVYPDMTKLDEMHEFGGGPFYMGHSDERAKSTGEYPVRVERVDKPFLMDRFPVSNGDFAAFVRRTNYRVTSADRALFSYVFYLHIKDKADLQRMRGVTPRLRKEGETENATALTAEEEKENALNLAFSHRLQGAELKHEPWWIPVHLARWNRPYGPNGGTIAGLENHPVVHVSLFDAAAYCSWKGKRLPTEKEWEYAARADNNTFSYPWGEGFRRNRMNVWQGTFPVQDDGWDGFKGVSPINRFPPQNKANMFDMLGNVWEWTETWWNRLDYRDERVVLKGGSFADTVNDDEKITQFVRCSARLGRPGNFTAGNVGFRCAKTVEPPPTTKSASPTPRFIRYEDTWHYREEMRKLALTFHDLRSAGHDDGFTEEIREDL